MAVVNFHFHENDRFISNLIEWRTASHISHVSVEIKGCYYQAYLNKRFHCTMNIPNDIVDTVSLEVDDDTLFEIQEMLNDGLGKLYDVKSIWGWLVNKSRQSTGRFYCSEMALTVATKIIGMRPKIRKLVSPNAVWIALTYYQYGLENKEES